MRDIFYLFLFITRTYVVPGLFIPEINFKHKVDFVRIFIEVGHFVLIKMTERKFLLHDK